MRPHRHKTARPHVLVVERQKRPVPIRGVIMPRTLLALAVCGIAVGGMAPAHHTGTGHGKVAQPSQRDNNEKPDGKAARATVQKVTFEPGQKDSPHRHTGPAFVYVLEGEYEHAIDDEPV